MFKSNKIDLTDNSSSRKVSPIEDFLAPQPGMYARKQELLLKSDDGFYIWLSPYRLVRALLHHYQA